ncbi:MAG TPA: integrase core domain-containing protein [Roseiflexaceae bacterium]|nr:integrase core domain-containing protein [Roseiflexaceae bacterium]
MGTDADWYAARTTLRTLMRTHPNWSTRDFADAVRMSRCWVKKWRKRITAAPNDELVLRGRSRVPHHRPPKLSALVVERILAIRDAPPDNLRRTPGPRAISYYLARDLALLEAGVRIPRSTRTIWQILRQHGRIALPLERSHQPVERPEPMSAWQLDFKDVSTVPADPDGKQQHVVEVLNSVDTGTSILVDAQVQSDFTAETSIEAVVRTLRATGCPASITLDRDPRFVGSPQGSDFPAPLVRLLLCLGIQVHICPPRRPDKNAFVERYHRTLEAECLRLVRPHDLASAREAVSTFRQHYNRERPNQAVSCQNRPPLAAFPELPTLPALPAQVDPDRWVQQLHGTRLVRKVNTHGMVKVDNRLYYVDQSWAGRYLSLRIDGVNRVLQVEYQERPTGKVLPIKGLVGQELPLEEYLTLIVREARTQNLGGRPLGRQLLLPLTNA